MKVLVIPDVHLKPWIFDKADELIKDVFSTYRDKTQIGESAFLIIETETGKYEVKRV